MKFRILGLSASLRNARRGKGNARMLEELQAIETKPELMEYLKQQANIHLENFKEAGRNDKLPFDELYANLKKLKGDRGMSNSEIALASALWSAKSLGAEIDHLSLAEHFPDTGKRHHLDDLKARLRAADGVIMSTPVYFGDRSSVAHSLVELIREDEALLRDMRGKIFAGVAVGAKRNGGQETTLIYQLLDMTNCDMLGVGNDSETTSQYGGTGWAGDIGTMPNDSYGIDTSMGAGRRVARVAAMMKMAESQAFDGKCNVAFWILQDREGEAQRYVERLVASGKYGFNASIIDMSGKRVMPCVACDVCPTHIDVDASYRCIIRNKNDAFPGMHEEIIQADAVVPVVLSTRARDNVQSNYQRFIERTRYLRRGDYVFSDWLCAPLVIEELGANENMHIRLLTSMLRHHTIMVKPMIGYTQAGKDLNFDEVGEHFHFVDQMVARSTRGRLNAYAANVEHLKYNPVGYVLSAMKDQEDVKMQRRAEMIRDRVERARRDNRLPMVDEVVKTIAGED
jgi:multimeric flavodoxin WrbA